MDLAELGRDMVALQQEAKQLPGRVGEVLSRIASLAVDAERFVQELATTRDAVRHDLGKVQDELGTWRTEADQVRTSLDGEARALDAALDEHLPLLQTRREELADALRRLAEAAGVMEKDLVTGTESLEGVKAESADALDALGAAALKADEDVGEGMDAVRLETEQMEEAARTATNAVEQDLAALRSTMDTLAEQAAQRVADTGRELGQTVDAHGAAVADAVAALSTAQDAFTTRLTGEVDERLREWEQPLSGAVTALETLDGAAEEASARISASAKKLDESFAGVGDLDKAVGAMIGKAKDAASDVGLDWVS